jgi:hypothetical protein
MRRPSWDQRIEVWNAHGWETLFGRLVTYRALEIYPSLSSDGDAFGALDVFEFAPGFHFELIGAPRIGRHGNLTLCFFSLLS